jgi:hypothetical protein
VPCRDARREESIEAAYENLDAAFDAIAALSHDPLSITVMATGDG